MGSEASSPNGKDFGGVPENLVCFVPCGSVILLVTQSELEVRDRREILASRKTGLTATCACCTGSGTFMIGFSNGTLSEFDVKLCLVNTYCVPGGRRAHEGVVTSVTAQPSGEPLVLSLGDDQTWNVWNGEKGSLVSSFPFAVGLMWTCASSTFAWASDKVLHIHVLNLKNLSMRQFTAPGVVQYMEPIGNGGGVIAVTEDGAVHIFSSTGVVTHFGGNRAKRASILGIRRNDGLVNFVSGDWNGCLSLRALEHDAGSVMNDAGVFAVSERDVIVASSGRVVSVSKDFLVARLQKSLPDDMQLPWRSICDFLEEDRCSVFAHTAVKASRVPGTFGSILDVDPTQITSEPKFTEAATNRALKKLGLVPKDLVKMSRYDMAKVPGSDDVRRHIINELEERRLATIKSVIEARKEFLTVMDSSAKQSSGYEKEKVNDDRRFAKLKKAQLLLLVKEQMKRKEIEELDKLARQRLEEVKNKKMMDKALRKQAGSAKAQGQLDRVKRAEEARQRVADELMDKRMHETERRVAQQQAFMLRNQEARREANAQRRSKLEMIQAAHRAREKEVLRKAELDMSLTREKQEQVARKKQERIMQVKERRKQNELQAMERLERVHRREADEKKQVEEKLERSKEEIDAKVAAARYQKMASMQQRVSREKMKLQEIYSRLASKNAYKGNEDDERVEKWNRVEANRKALSSCRRQKYEENARQMRVRSEAASQQKTKNEEMMIAKVTQAIERQGKVHERRAALVEQKSKEIMDKAAQTYLKQKLGEEKARRLERKKAFETEETAGWTANKTKNMEQQRERERQEQARAKRTALKQQVKEQDELERMKKVIQENPNIDPAELAKQFNIV